MSYQEHYPQTDAEELERRFHDKKLISISKYGCCAFTALWIMGIEGGIGNICIVADQIGKSLDTDCTVYWKQFFLNVCGSAVEVEFRDIKSLSELSEIGRCAVRYDYNGKSHWVGVERGAIAYNSLKHSVCVEKGRPTTARIIRSADGGGKWN